MTALEAIEEVTKLRQEAFKFDVIGGSIYTKGDSFWLIVNLVDINHIRDGQTILAHDMEELTTAIFDGDIHGYGDAKVECIPRRNRIEVTMTRGNPDDGVSFV